MRRVVITGMGILNSLGAGLNEVWPRLLGGANGIKPISFFDASRYRSKVAAEVTLLGGAGRLDGESYAAQEEVAGVREDGIRRGTRVFLECAREAFGSSGLAESGFNRDAAGVSAGFSAAYMGVELVLDYYRHRRGDGLDVDLRAFASADLQPAAQYTRRVGDATAALPAKLFGFRGPSSVCDTACAASGHAIGDAFRLIRLGRADVMLAGGATAIVSPIAILYFAMLGALSRNGNPDSASRPFDRDRDGFVMGEGGGVVVMEDYDHARARGATILAEVAGFGSNTCAINLTDPSADGGLEAQAMRLALQSAKLAPEEIGFVAAHGTSTEKNDRTEAKAIRQAFGAWSKNVLVSSNKGQLGHTISGAAVTNLICAVQAMRNGIVPPTMHLETLDSEVDLDCVPNEARRAPISAALINSFAFGGHNAVIAVRAAS